MLREFSLDSTKTFKISQKNHKANQTFVFLISFNNTQQVLTTGHTNVT